MSQLANKGKLALNSSHDWSIILGSLVLGAGKILGAWLDATIDPVGPAKCIISTHSTNPHEMTKSGFLYSELHVLSWNVLAGYSNDN